MNTFQLVRAHLLNARDTLVHKAIAADARVLRANTLPFAQVIPLGRAPLLRPLESVNLNWTHNPPCPNWSLLRRAAKPLFTTRAPRVGYAEAILDAEPERWMFDGRHFRLLALHDRSGALELSLAPGSYFSTLDSCELLAHEMAANDNGWPVRDAITSPRHFAARSAGLGVCAITIVMRERGPFIYLLRRSQKVAVASGMTHVVPAGEFQPSRHLPWDHPASINLISHLDRELLEELAGIPEDEDRPPCLRPHLDRGDVQAYTWGLFVDALTWKPELICALVFTEASFRAALNSPAATSVEGDLIGGVAGITLDKLTQHLAEDVSLVPVAQAAVALTLRDQDRLFANM